jgi:ribonuclease HII
MIVCGIDEAGRGPLAGPLTTSAVILPRLFPFGILDDSKKMSPREREKVALEIKRRAVDYAIGWCWPEEIDRLNIHRATLLAMGRAVRMLKTRPDLILVDGLFSPNLPYTCRTVVKGDCSIPQIQAASILAKTARDLWMIRYARIEPRYGFERHKGYATREHRSLVGVHGRSAIHRLSFKISVPSES